MYRSTDRRNFPRSLPFDFCDEQGQIEWPSLYNSQCSYIEIYQIYLIKEMVELGMYMNKIGKSYTIPETPFQILWSNELLWAISW
jgi:hypothetical protein